MERPQRGEKKRGPGIDRWVLVTPQDLKESARRKSGGDVTWLQNLGKGVPFEIEHWGHKKLQALFLETPSLCLFYYPGLLPDGAARKRTIEDTRRRYDDNFLQHHREIHFIGMSVLKEEAAKGVAIDQIYIPLKVVSADADVNKPDIARNDPLGLLERGGKHVVLGDPGSGKSTLLKFLALAGLSEKLQKRYRTGKDERRLPVLVILRDYADRLKEGKNLPLLDYIQEVAQADFSLNSADAEFFEYYLEHGEAVLLFDGLDELTERFKKIIRDRIRALGTTYPGNTIIVTSRIVGYSHPFRFDESEYRHHRVAPLQLPEMKSFIKDWYAARVDSKALRERNIADLTRILEDQSQVAIHDLARNPLLLTIIALVHRVDAVLPDARVVLYQKCTETLLNTWHYWKYKDQEGPKKGKIERRNRTRMEAIAHWMQCRGAESEDKRSIAPHKELADFLAEHIAAKEKARDPDDEPQDLAEEFLEFVKQRAGLLIEVGDQRYSFVHLTFQEYLTAAYFRTRAENKGIEAVWRELGQKRSESRWHEVIRLFTAALSSDEAQEHVVAALLEHEKEDNCAKLLGGFLLDGIASAEEREKEVVGRLFTRAGTAESGDRLQLLIEPLRLWVSKDESNQENGADWLASDFVRKKGAATRERLFLTAIAAQFPHDKLAEAASRALPNASVPFGLLFDLPAKEPSKALIQKYHSTHRTTQQIWSLEGPSSNFAAATTQFVDSLVSDDSMVEGAFTVALTCGISRGGPALDRLSNMVRTSPHRNESLLGWARDRARDLARARARALDRARARARNLDRDRARDRDLARDLARARARARNLDRDRARNLDRARARARDRARAYIALVFDLKPRPQWDEALKTSLLPRIPKLNRLFDESLWAEVENRFREGKSTIGNCFFAGWQLLTDSTLYIFGHHDKPEESPFARIAELTRDYDHPALRVAHCIRDLAYGDESRTDDLVAMVKSKDRAFRKIFEDALWIDPPAKAKSRRRQR